MIKRLSQPLCAWFLACDLLLTLAAWVGAYFIRFDSGLIPLIKDQPAFSHCLSFVPPVAVFPVVAYRLVGQYEIHRLRRFREEMVAVVKGVALLSLLVMSTNFFRHDPYESRVAMLLFGLLTALSILAV